MWFEVPIKSSDYESNTYAYAVNIIMQITVFTFYKKEENVQPIVLMGHSKKSIIKGNAIRAT